MVFFTNMLFWGAILYLISYIIRLIRKNLFNKKSIMVILGSGGHTGEMILMLKKLDFDKFDKVIFVHSNNDINSAKKLKESFKITSNTIIKSIYRSRNVGQSYKSSIITTFVAFFHSVILILQNRPNMIVTNGPGVSLPICYVGFILAKLNVLVEFKILFIESFCRTQNLSLSGKLIKPISDKFIVLWKSLSENGKGEYIGKII